MMKIHSVACVALLGALVGYGCSSSDGANEDGDGAGASGNGDGDGAGASGNGDGDGMGGDQSGGSGDGDGDGDGDGNNSGTSAGWTESDIPYSYDPTLDADPETCASDSIQAAEIPLDVMIVLDRSGSMTQPLGDNLWEQGDCNVGGTTSPQMTRWCNTINAIYDFASAPGSVGMGLSFDTFGRVDTNPNQGGVQQLCGAIDADDLAVPFDVLEPGDGNGLLATLRTQLNAALPRHGTPTEMAIETLKTHTLARRNALTAAGESRKVIGIVVTDGEPNGCEDNEGDLNDLAKAHFDTQGIPIFFIGMDGLNEGNLEEMALGTGADVHDTCPAGGTACADDEKVCGSLDECSFYSIGNGNFEAFNTALDAIRESVSGCDFAIPAGSGLVDLNGVSVTFTPGGGSAETLTSVANEGACSANDEYFVEGTGNDAIIKLCPTTCERNDDDATVDIVIPCQGQ